MNGWTFTGEIDNFGGEEKEGWERNQMVWEKSGRKGGGVFDSLFLVNGILRRFLLLLLFFSFLSLCGSFFFKFIFKDCNLERLFLFIRGQTGGNRRVLGSKKACHRIWCLEFRE